MEKNSDGIIQMQVLRIGLNNNKKIVVDWNHDMFNEMDDIEAMTIIMGIFKRLSNKLDAQIDEIEMDNAIEEDDYDENSLF